MNPGGKNPSEPLCYVIRSFSMFNLILIINCKAYWNFTCLVLHTVAFAHFPREVAMPLETILNILLAFHKFGVHNIPWALISEPLN
jgi:hypothetical protein